MNEPRRFLLPVLALLAVLASARADTPPDPDALGLSLQERFDALLERARYEQDRLQTLEATFVQRSESPLLLAPEEVRGTFSYRSPDRIRWDFGTPKNMTLTIRAREVLTWYRDLKRAERRPLGLQEDRMLSFLGAGPSLATLQRYFSFTATFPKAAAEPYVLELAPLSSRIEKRIRSMTLKLDRELFVPIYLRYVGREDSVTEIRFENLRINGELPEERFEIVLPDDVVLEIPPATGGGA